MNGKQEMQVHNFYYVQKNEDNVYIFFRFVAKKTSGLNRGQIPEKRRNSNKYKTLIKQQ